MLVVVIGLACAWFPLVGLVESGLHMLWGSTSGKWITRCWKPVRTTGRRTSQGRCIRPGETFLIATRQTGDQFLVGRSGDDTFAPGKVVKLWWSPSAPDLLIEGRRTNGIPVSSMPQRPGVLAFLSYALWLAAVVVLAVLSFRWAVTKASGGIAQMKIQS